MLLHHAVWAKGVQLEGYWLGHRGLNTLPKHLDGAPGVSLLQTSLTLDFV